MKDVTHWIAQNLTTYRSACGGNGFMDVAASASSFNKLQSLHVCSRPLLRRAASRCHQFLLA